MRDKKKAVFNLIFLLVVFGLTIYGVVSRRRSGQYAIGNSKSTVGMADSGNCTGIVFYLGIIYYHLVHDAVLRNKD